MLIAFALIRFKCGKLRSMCLTALSKDAWKSVRYDHNKIQKSTRTQRKRNTEIGNALMCKATTAACIIGKMLSHHIIGQRTTLSTDTVNHTQNGPDALTAHTLVSYWHTPETVDNRKILLKNCSIMNYDMMVLLLIWVVGELWNG